MEKAFTIEDLYASAWQTAIKNVHKEVSGVLWSADISLDKELSWQTIEALCRVLGIRFDINGEIVR